MDTLLLRFVREKETTNTVRFKEVGAKPVIGTLYVSKAVADGVDAVIVTVTDVTERDGSKEAK